MFISKLSIPTNSERRWSIFKAMMKGPARGYRSFAPSARAFWSLWLMKCHIHGHKSPFSVTLSDSVLSV